MKLKFIACAIAAVCAQSAFALDFAATKAIQIAFEGGSTTNHVVYLTGASALAKSVPGALDKICAVGTRTTFDSTDSNVKAYSCTIGATAPAGMASGDKLLMGLSVSEGSFSGVISQSSANFTYNFGAGVKNAWNNQIEFATATTAPSTSSAVLIRRRSAGGFMDVQPALFSDLAALLPSLDANPSNYTETPVAAGQAFGVAVSISLYNALQAAQGIACAAGDYTAACQPSITKGQYASLIAQSNAGAIADWSSLGLSSSQPVNLCRRVPTSGTQAASNAFFLGKGCSSGAVLPSASADSTATYVVTENSGSSNVATCLGNASNFAIGVISAENALATTAWRFVKLDGVPVFEGVVGGKARQNAIDQKYGFHFEFVTVSRNSANAASQGLIAALGNTISDPTLTDLTGITIVPGVNAAFEVNADRPTLIQKATTGGQSCAPALYFY